VKPIHILQIFNRYLEYGGEEKIVFTVPQLFNDKAHVIETCLFESSSWKGTSAPPIWRQPFLMLRNPSALEQLRQYHLRFKPDVWLVHNIFPVGSAAVYQLALELKVPVIHYCHNYRPFSVSGTLWDGIRIEPAGLHRNFWPEIRRGSWQKSRLKSFCMAYTLKKLHTNGWLKSVKTWIAISDFVRERFIEAGIPAEQIFTLRHSWPSQKPSIQSDPQQNHFLFLGRLNSYKGIQPLLDCWHIIYKKLGQYGPQLMVGGEGPMSIDVQKAAKNNPLISQLGMVSGDYKTQLLHNCLALIVPALWWEPLGLVTYEAYHFSKPVLAARSGGITETVIDNQTGLLHQPGNASELADHVIKLYKNPDLATQMGRAGNLWLEENANEKKWLAGFHKIIQHTIGMH
jgi:glycosyltransferase involved in cell wall biosynthesis